MTNEDIVWAIRLGESDMIPELLEQNAGIIRRVAAQYLTAARRNRGADLEDLMQAAAVGMLCAVDAWDERRGKFIPYAIYHMRKEILALLGLRGRERVENESPPVSLSAFAGSEEEANPADILPDPNAIDPQAAAEENELRRIVRGALANLPKLEAETVKGHRLQGKPLPRLSAELGHPVEELRKAESSAFRALRREKSLVYLWREYECACWKKVGIHGFSNTWTSATEAAVLHRERIAEQITEMTKRNGAHL